MELGRGMSASGAAGLAGRFALGVRPALRGWRGVLPSFTPAVCASLPVLCVRLTCRGAGLVRGDALSGGAFGFRCARPYGSVAAFCLRSRLLFVLRQTGRLAMACVPVPRVEIAICAFSMCRRGTGAGLRNVGAFSAAFDLGLRPASRGYCGVLPSFTSVVRFC